MKKRLIPLILVIAIGVGLLSAVSVGAVWNSNFYYEQLTAQGKKIYNTIVRGLDDMKQGTPAVMTVDCTTAQFQIFEKDFYAAAEAVLQDKQMVFWASSWEYSAEYTNQGTSSRDVYRYTVRLKLTVNPSWGRNGRSIAADEKLVSSQVAALAGEARKAGAGRYDQLLWLHDWLTRNNEYNTDAASHSAASEDGVPWCVVSGLDPDLGPVCEGYSRAFQLVCVELNIPCIIVSGYAQGPHMWNYVQMENGKWYAVDVTFDDPVVRRPDGSRLWGVTSGYESRDNFLRGASFLKGHSPDADVVYPELAADDFKKGQDDVAPDPEIFAYPATQTVLIDGLEYDLPMYSLHTGDSSGTNYIRVRDLASVLSGSAAGFAVGWNQEALAVTLVSHAAYAPRGDELNVPYGGYRPYTRNAANTWVDGVPAAKLESFSIEDDQGDGNTYYKLRDLGENLGFNVGWDGTKGMVFIETNKPYDPTN